MLSLKYKHVIQSAYHALNSSVPQMFTVVSKQISFGLPVSKHVAMAQQRPHSY